jgi:hypothetical protein
VIFHEVLKIASREGGKIVDVLFALSAETTALVAGHGRPVCRARLRNFDGWNLVFHGTEPSPRPRGAPKRVSHGTAQAGEKLRAN